MGKFITAIINSFFGNFKNIKTVSNSEEIMKNRIIENGIEIKGIISDFGCFPDSRDSEHEIFQLDIDYEINGKKYNAGCYFSINTVHIEYAYLGQLLDTPKIEYNLENFKDSFKRGNIIELKVLENDPTKYIILYNEIAREIMKIQAVWR